MKKQRVFIIVAVSFFVLRCSCDGGAVEDGEEGRDLIFEEAVDQPVEISGEDPVEELPDDPVYEDIPPEDAGEEDARVEDRVEEDAGPEPYTCFSASPPGEYRGTIGCFDIYTTCSPGSHSDHLLIKRGVNGELTVDEMAALKDLVETDVMNLPFVDMFGIGITCCDDTTNAGCYYIHLMGNSGVTVEQMAERLSEMEPLCSDANCLGITVSIPFASGPRCAVGDPDCLPLAMCDPENCPGGSRPDPGCCPDCSPYEPDMERIVAIGVHPDALVGPEYEHLEVLIEEEAGECTYDGECILNGCGQYCSSYDDYTFISTCECYPALSLAFCGCTGGLCRWFYQ